LGRAVHLEAVAVCAASIRHPHYSRVVLARRSHRMRIMIGTAALVAAMGLMLAFTTSSNEDPTAMDPGCEKACDEVYQACDEKCKNNVDNDMCEPECISALRHCTAACG
jgi:hypothetical protein